MDQIYLYLSLNTGILLAGGFFLHDNTKGLPFDVPIPLWFINFVLFLTGAYLARAWQTVGEDAIRWQTIIDEHIAAVESTLFTDKSGLYEHIVKDYKCAHQEDVTHTNVRIAKFFFHLWVIASMLSLTLFILVILGFHHTPFQKRDFHLKLTHLSAEDVSAHPAIE